MKSTVKTVGLVMAITMFSRLLSLLSNLVYITYFGINLETDIYSYAIQLPNIIFNTFGTALVTVIIPVFAGYIGTGEKERAFRFANNVTSLSLIFTLVLTIVGIAIAPLIILMTRFRHEGYDFALMALRIMFPVIIFYALNYILQGILQSLGRYNAPALVSVPSSLVVILYVFLLGDRFGVAGLVVATFVGLSLQALILIPPTFTTEYRYKPSFNFRDEDIKKAMKLVPPILLGTSAYQINMLFNATLSANFENAVALITTVQNLVLYAILAFIYSVTSVIFPKLTMLAARNDMEDFKNSLLKVLKSVLYLMIPAAAGFIAVRYQLIDFLYGWGKVTADNVLLASRMLALYALGVIGIGVKEVVDRAFYSLKDTKRPAINGVIIMLVNIGASLGLVSYIGVLGIPLAYSISALTGAFVLMIMVRMKIGPFGGGQLIVATLKFVGASAVMLAAVIPLVNVLGQLNFGNAILDKALRLFIPCAVGGFVYFVFTYLLKVEEAVDVLEKIRGKK